MTSQNFLYDIGQQDYLRAALSKIIWQLSQGAPQETSVLRIHSWKAGLGCGIFSLQYRLVKIRWFHPINSSLYLDDITIK